MAEVGEAIDLYVLELMCSRLCHDLVGPAGAVSAGLEFIFEMDGEPDPEAVALVTNSAADGLRRLQFARIALGFAGGDEADGSAGEYRQLAVELLDKTQVKLDWPEVHDGPRLKKRAVKLLLNMILLGSEALPRGGQLSLAYGEPGSAGQPAIVTAAGDGARLRQEVADALADGARPGDQTPRSVQAYYCARLAASLGVSLTLVLEPDRVAISAILPTL